VKAGPIDEAGEALHVAEAFEGTKTLNAGTIIAAHGADASEAERDPEGLSEGTHAMGLREMRRRGIAADRRAASRMSVLRARSDVTKSGGFLGTGRGWAMRSRDHKGSGYAVDCDRCSDTGWVRCSVCDGTGAMADDRMPADAPETLPCDECDGYGEVECVMCGRPAFTENIGRAKCRGGLR
jgi:hypothetical protein